MPEDKINISNMDNIALVHFCYMINDWESKLKNQIDRIFKSGLYFSLKEYHLVVTDVSNQKQNLLEIIKNYPKINLSYFSNNSLYETNAIKKVEYLAFNNSNLNILYIHVKGITNYNIKNYKTKEISLQKAESVESFIEMLEHTLIDNWQRCVEKLNEGYNIVGLNCIGGWWWGNYWWSNSEYLKKGNKFTFDEIKDAGNRWKCERWVQVDNPLSHTIGFKKYEFYHFLCDPYYTLFPKYLYERNSDIEFYIQKVEYGYFSEAQHEAQSIPLDYDIIKDVTHFFEKKYIGRLKLSYKDNFPNIDDSVFKPHYEVKIKVYYNTNIDPENTYFVSSIPSNLKELIYFDI